MPYINEKNRDKLDSCINELILCLRATVLEKMVSDKDGLDNEDISKIAGNINYTFSRICASLVGDPTYPKIALITGVLENIKQEFYRRVAEAYEDQKILQNGDIREYKLLK